jgi:hypothetical protein
MIWSADVQRIGGYEGSDTFFVASGHLLVIVGGPVDSGTGAPKASLQAFNPADGSPAWKTDLSAANSSSMFPLDADHVLIATCPQDCSAQDVDTSSGQLLWTSDGVASGANGDVLLLANAHGPLLAADQHSGKTRYQFDGVGLVAGATLFLIQQTFDQGCAGPCRLEGRNASDGTLRWQAAAPNGGGVNRILTGTTDGDAVGDVQPSDNSGAGVADSWALFSHQDGSIKWSQQACASASYGGGEVVTEGLFISRCNVALRVLSVADGSQIQDISADPNQSLALASQATLYKVGDGVTAERLGPASKPLWNAPLPRGFSPSYPASDSTSTAPHAADAVDGGVAVVGTTAGHNAPMLWFLGSPA